MINLLISYLFFFLAGFSGAMLGCWIFSKKKWSLYFNETTKSLELRQDPKEEAVFLPEPTAQELEDMASPAWSRFLGKFKIKR